MAAINSRDKPSWLVAAVSQKLSGITLLLLLHCLPQAVPAGQHLPLHLPKSLTSGSFCCCQSLVLPRLMVRYFWWRQSLRVIFIDLNITYSIFDSFSCNRTQWIVDKVMIEHSLHSVRICDIHTAAEQQCVHVQYSECAAVHIKRAAIMGQFKIAKTA